MTFTEFVKKYLGKATDYDNYAGVQCVDLAKLYIDKVLGVKPQSIGNAHAYYDDFENTYLKKYFNRIPYKSGVKPQKGDLVVWAKKYNGKSKYGHIAIATGKYDNTYIYTYDQNYGEKKMHEVRHTFKGIAGFLRPKDQNNIVGKVYFKPDAEINKECDVYADNKLQVATGHLLKGEKVKTRFKGKVLAIVQYNTYSGYAVGLVKLKNITLDK